MKRLLACLLIAVMTVSLLAGCGKKDEQKNNNNTSTQSKDSDNNAGNNTENNTGNNGGNSENEPPKPSWTIETLPESSAGLEFELNEDGKGYTVTGIGTCTATDIVIGKYNNLPVTSIDAYAFSGCENLTSIEIPNSVTSIGLYAFEDCYSLTYTEYNYGIYLGNSTNPYVVLVDVIDTSETSFTIPNTTNIIYYSTFKDCDSLTSIEIPNSVTSIGLYAFYNCTSLTSIKFVENSKLASIDAHAFSGCSSLMSIEIPNGVTSIGDSAFEDCTSLTSIEIPNSVTSIGYSAFYNCDSLNYTEYNNGKYLGNSENQYFVMVEAIDRSVTSFTIPNTTKIIYASAFRDCDGLTSITIPSSITSIGNSAFSKCTGLTEINFNAAALNDLDLNNHAFSYAGQSGIGITVNIGANVTKIPGSLFGPDIGLDGTIDDSSYTPQIKSVVFAEGSVCESIGTLAFAGCSSLTSIEIPNSVTSIGYAAFAGCSNLTSIEIPNSVTSIGEWAFAGCSKLTSIEIPNSVTNIGDYAFAGYSSLTSITVDSNNTAYKSVDGNLYTKDGKTLIQYAIGKNATSFAIPSGVENIESYAFASCSNLTIIWIPSSVTSIGKDSFRLCDLKSVIFENTSGWWYASDANSTSGTSISSADLTDSAKAAKYLTDTYDSCYWKRS